MNMFLSRVCGEPIGFTVLRIFVIDRNTILTVSKTNLDLRLLGSASTQKYLCSSVESSLWYSRLSHPNNRRAIPGLSLSNLQSMQYVNMRIVTTLVPDGRLFN